MEKEVDYGKNGNGFRVAFWVMAIITTVFCTGIVNAVVGNDRLNTIDHKDIRSVLNDKLNSIDMRLTRIEAKLEPR